MIKKIVIAEALSLLAIAIIMISFGIYIKLNNPINRFNSMLEGSGAAGLVLLLFLFIPYILIKISGYVLICLGILYALWSAGIVFSGVKRYVRRLYYSTRTMTVTSSILLALMLIFIDFTILAYASAAVIAFCVLLTVFDAALVAVSAVCSPKLKRLLIQPPLIFK